MKKVMKKLLIFVLVLGISLSANISVATTEINAATKINWKSVSKKIKVASKIKEICEDINFTYKFYIAAREYSDVSTSTAKVNHVKNVYQCGRIFYTGHKTLIDVKGKAYRKKMNLEETIEYIIENSEILKPVNLELDIDSSDAAMQERMVCYIISCISDYDYLAEFHGQKGGLGGKCIFDKFGRENKGAKWSLNSAGARIVYKSHKEGTWLFKKTVYDYNKSIYVALAKDDEFEVWREHSPTLKKIKVYNAAKMVEVAADFLASCNYR